jgi:hypothetical protein
MICFYPASIVLNADEQIENCLRSQRRVWVGGDVRGRGGRKRRRKDEKRREGKGGWRLEMKMTTGEL